MVKVVNMRFLLGGSIAMYGLYFLFMGRKTEMTKYQVTYSLDANCANIVRPIKESKSDDGLHDQLPAASICEKVYVPRVRKALWGQL